MKLGSYLRDHDISVAGFAKRIGVTPEAVRLYVTGERRPRNPVLLSIMRETDGEVGVGDFYGPEEEEIEPRKRAKVRAAR